MRVILLVDVANLGKKYDIKEVKPGFARNFLFPKKLAKPATPKNMDWAEKQKIKMFQEAEDELKKIQELASSIDGQEVTFPVAVGEEGQLFESITVQKICEKLKEKGFEVKKSQIVLQDPIKEVGDFPVKIRFDHNLESEITLVVAPDEKNN